MKKLFTTLLIIPFAVAMTAAHADQTASRDYPFVASLFTDNMVLQRGMSDPVWGWTTPGARVTVSIAGKSASAVAGTDGEYVAHLPPLPVGGPYTLSVSGPQTATLSNVLVGDVWICSGQSNMEFGISKGLNAADEIAAANFPQIRLYTTNKNFALDPQSTTKGQWVPCSPDTVKNTGTWEGFTAVGYFFGRALYQSLHVPIGLVQSAWGGTPAQSWTSEEALARKVPAFKADLIKIDAQREANKQTAPAGAAAPQTLSINPYYPTTLYNGMISPLIPYGIKGAIWYQGEANAGQAHQYRTLLPAMIGDWRQRWGEGDFPFYIVQLASFMDPPDQPREDDWAALREAQSITAANTPNTGIASAIDLGEAKDIHPRNKQEVGRRLALAALAQTYGQKIEYSGPLFDSMRVEAGGIRVKFTHAKGGLVAKGGDPVKGFAIAGADGKFVWANARIDGATAIVSSSEIPNPTAVRYAWAANPVCNLYNQDGLPASPFRTDLPVDPVPIVIPASAGPNLALGKPHVAVDINLHGWDSGLTDGSWDANGQNTFASGETDAFPKTVTIDLQTPAALRMAALGVPGFGSTKTITVSVSEDNQTFHNVGTYVFSLRKEERHLFTFAPIQARYVRLTYPDHYTEIVGYPVNYVFTTEVEVYAGHVGK